MPKYCLIPISIDHGIQKISSSKRYEFANVHIYIVYEASGDKISQIYSISVWMHDSVKAQWPSIFPLLHDYDTAKWDNKIELTKYLVKHKQISDLSYEYINRSLDPRDFNRSLVTLWTWLTYFLVTRKGHLEATELNIGKKSEHVRNTVAKMLQGLPELALEGVYPFINNFLLPTTNAQEFYALTSKDNIFPKMFAVIAAIYQWGTSLYAPPPYQGPLDETNPSLGRRLIWNLFDKLPRFCRENSFDPANAQQVSGYSSQFLGASFPATPAAEIPEKPLILQAKNRLEYTLAVLNDYSVKSQSSFFHRTAYSRIKLLLRYYVALVMHCKGDELAALMAWQMTLDPVTNTEFNQVVFKIIDPNFQGWHAEILSRFSPTVIDCRAYLNAEASADSAIYPSIYNKLVKPCVDNQSRLNACALCGNQGFYRKVGNSTEINCGCGHGIRWLLRKAHGMATQTLSMGFTNPLYKEEEDAVSLTSRPLPLIPSEYQEPLAGAAAEYQPLPQVDEPGYIGVRPTGSEYLVIPGQEEEEVAPYKSADDLREDKRLARLAQATGNLTIQKLTVAHSEAVRVMEEEEGQLQTLAAPPPANNPFAGGPLPGSGRASGRTTPMGSAPLPGSSGASGTENIY